MKTAKTVGSSKTKKYVYFFGNGKAEGSKEMKSLLGGKGANLAEMTNLGIPVPPGFTISTQACIEYYKNSKKYPAGLENEISSNLEKLEKLTGKKLGNTENPLLVSVRSGAAFSMPGMMDTILNLGLNDHVTDGLAKKSKNERFAYDSYRRFIQMFGDVVLEIEHAEFEHILSAKKAKHNVKSDAELSSGMLKEIVNEYKALVKKDIGKDFPQDPHEQLRLATNAVFESWNNKRAISYRKLNGIPNDLGTAVNIQTMVFGNLGNTSGTGVAFTRNPSTGENKFYGEYLINAQGEDVVAGIRTPNDISQLGKDMPVIYKELLKIQKKLEAHYKDMQDLEFTIEDQKLYLLQTRNGKRTAQAAVNVAVDMVKEKLITKEIAVTRISPEQINQLLHPMIEKGQKLDVIAKGLPASPGAAVGKVVFTAEEAVKLAKNGEDSVLVRLETSPEDIEGMASARGILTARGGMTSHAAVVGRGMGKCCVVGCNEITVHEEEKILKIGKLEIKEGEYLTLNGSTGEVIKGKVKLAQPQFTGNFKTLIGWADEIRKLKIRTNADTPKDASIARDFGAEGIGLTRTEHMFFGADRLPFVRRMIMAEDETTRQDALKHLLPMQREDFKGIFKAMKGFPVTIRLLDPPLHEFLPHGEDEIQRTALDMDVTEQKIREINQSLHELNPMLGHRGCRLGITYPEIYKMQARAIFEAAAEVIKGGISIVPEIMIPLVGHINELKICKNYIVEIAEEIMKNQKVKMKYSIGTMIEIPRAAITADEIAKEAEFFSFGTNDLTQMTFGFSRDDAGKFLPFYVEKNILENDPFVSIDRIGVGGLMKIGVERGRKVSPTLKIGICGEHGGDPSSIEFCHSIGLNYVSCSPYRVPIARLAAAQAVLKEKALLKNKK